MNVSFFVYDLFCVPTPGSYLRTVYVTLLCLPVLSVMLCACPAHNCLGGRGLKIFFLVIRVSAKCFLGVEDEFVKRGMSLQ